MTAAEEHNRHPVTAMLYSSSYQGLADGDGHAGWLVSASNRLLNLWECNAGGGVAGEPSLQVGWKTCSSTGFTVLAARCVLFSGRIAGQEKARSDDWC